MRREARDHQRWLRVSASLDLAPETSHNANLGASYTHARATPRAGGLRLLGVQRPGRAAYDKATLAL